MTDRLKGFVVTLDGDYREDDAEGIRKALEMVKGVLSDQPLIGGYEHRMAREQAKAELQKELWNVLK